MTTLRFLIYMFATVVGGQNVRGFVARLSRRAPADSRAYRTFSFVNIRLTLSVFSSATPPACQPPLHGDAAAIAPLLLFT